MQIKYLRSKYKLLDIGVDGGVGPTNIDYCAEAGANMIVSGTAIVKSDEPRKVIAQLRNVVDEALQRFQLER